MTKSNTLLTRCILVMGVISVLSVGCKKAPAGSRGGGSEPQVPGTEQKAQDPSQQDPTPEEVVPHVPDPTEIE